MKLNNQKSLRTHRKAAKLLKNMYETHLSRILEDIKEVEYCLRAKEIFVENEEEKLEYILTPEEVKIHKSSQQIYYRISKKSIQIAELEPQSLTKKLK